MIADFHFLRPWWLLGVLAALALVWLVARRMDMRARWSGMIAPALLDHLLIEPGATRRFRPVHLTAVLIAVGSLAAAGPTWRREQPPFVEDAAPLAIAIDLSPTMDAIDISPTRLERAKLKVRDILGRREGARTALFAYAGSAHRVLPLTEDATLVETYVGALSTAIMPVAGKDTARALALADAALADQEAPGTILFLTDGIEQRAFPAFADYAGRNDILVLGMGTADGGPVKVAQGRYLTDASGARLVARLDIEALKTLQARSPAQVATVTADDRDVDWIVRRIRTAFQQKLAEGNARWQDMGWWLTFAVAALGVFWFRKGWSVRWASVVAGAVMLLPATDARAEWRFADIWLTPDQQGRLAFDRGDYGAAADRFADANWRGVALYRAGRFGAALDAFATVDTADSYYNQGNALMHLDRPDDAAAAYRQALARRPEWDLARANLAIAERLLAARKKDEKDDEAQDPNQAPDQIQFDDKGKKGKEGVVDAAEQSAEMWMRNIQVSPADLLKRKFAIEAEAPRQ